MKKISDDPVCSLGSLEEVKRYGFSAFWMKGEIESAVFFRP